MFEQIPITGRAQWLATRLLDVTASEIAALKNVHPYVSPFALYARKIAATVDDTPATGQMERGLLLQPVAMEKLRLDHPDWRIWDPLNYYRHKESRIGATPDAFCNIPGRDGLGVIQIKSVEPGIFKRTWLTNGEVEPPLWIVIQAAVEAWVTGASYAMVAPMVIGHKVDVHLIEIPLRTDLIDSLKADVAEFWQRVENRRPPEVTSPTDFEVVAKLYKPTVGTIDLTADNALTGLADRDDELKAIIKDADAERKTIKARFVAAIDSAEIGFLADGRAIVAKTIHRKEAVVPAYSYLSVTVRDPK